MKHRSRNVKLLATSLIMIAGIVGIFGAMTGPAVSQSSHSGMSSTSATATIPTISDMPGPDTGQQYRDRSHMDHMVTQDEREAAADRARAAGLPASPTSSLQYSQPVTAALDPGGVPDYFGTIPNYANSQLPHIQGTGPARDYYGAWYDTVYMRSWVLMTNPSGATQNVTFNLAIDGSTKTLPDAFGHGAGVVPGASTLPFTEPGLLGAPVKATSTNGGQAIVSQRSLFGDSFEEILTTESTKLSDHFYWPWYDEQSPGFQNWVIVDNPSATETVHAVVSYLDQATAAAVMMGESDILPGESWTPNFPRQIVGPVELKAYLATGTWATEPRPVVASQRVLSNYGTAFNELPGLRAEDLSTDYLWTWYDMQSPGFQDWILIANPDLVNPVNYTVKIAGTNMESGSIPPAGIVTLEHPGVMNGPVEVVTEGIGGGDGKVIASQRTIAGPSFGEVPGYSRTDLSNTYQWTWYDMQSSGSTNWVLIANPDPANAVDYQIKIAGAIVDSGSIPANGKVTPTFPGLMNGPVEVLATGDVIASQRVLWNGYFNELTGVGGLVPLGTVVPDTGLRKFVDTVPGLGAADKNNLDQYIPVAIPDTATYDGADYYEISLVEYTEQMHSDLPPTRLRGYVQTNTTDAEVSVPHYLGPMIVASKDRPVRIKFTNQLDEDSAGEIFLPVDTTTMGAGEGPMNAGGSPCDPDMEDCASYTENRSTIHLHGGATPWISDGTPHQWITPANETTPYTKGVSAQNAPDMFFDPATHEPVSEGAPGATNDPGPGSQTYYYTNQQSARLMFYHDHAYGITRLNVYDGVAAGYLLQDDKEQELLDSHIIPADQIPLVIQDKSFVPETTQLEAEDPTWDITNWGGEGNLWMPHVYVPAQNPADPGGMNAMGRWHYGPWFFPPTLGITNPPIPNPLYDCGSGDPCTRPWEPSLMPDVPNPSAAPEAFMDTPVVNGTPYPTITVEPKAYRFRVLNAANDRFWNLQLYKADHSVISRDGMIDSEVRMVPAAQTAGFPESWPADGREGGVPDPTTAGPEMIQIANEGGFLPAPAVLPNQPVAWNLDQTTFNFGNVTTHTLLLGPAERADIVVDFSQYAGQTLILYNDAPAAFPALDPRYDYFTGAPDRTDTGGAPTTQPGFGPNTRTVMQIKIADSTPAAPFDMAALNTAFASTGLTEGVFAASQDPVLVPQDAYNSAYNANYPATNIAHIFDFSMTFTPAGFVTPLTIPFQRKAIQDEMGEAFNERDGRMSAKLGLQLPFTPGGTDFVLQGYPDKATEEIQDSMTPMAPAAADGTQIWKITQNGVDTHTMHWHLFNVQLINRVAWDGMLLQPDANELGWKETVRVNPLEDTIVALRPVAPTLPFEVPGSVRPMDVTRPIGSSMGLTQIDPYSGQPAVVTNQMVNYGWEYVWHCHLLGHEENDMMRPIRFSVNPPAAPSGLTAAEIVPATINLDWVNNATTPAAVTFIIERATDAAFTTDRAQFSVAAPTVTYDDVVGPTPATYYYRVRAENATGFSAWSATATIVT